MRARLERAIPSMIWYAVPNVLHCGLHCGLHCVVHPVEINLRAILS